jgi:hypothetical protein
MTSLVVPVVAVVITSDPLSSTVVSEVPVGRRCDAGVNRFMREIL